MTPFVQDADFALYVGDALTVLSGLPDESVHCCVTSPPYWGLRDYGTGEWEKPPCLYPLLDGRRCAECAACHPAPCDHLRPAAHGYEPFATSTLGPKRDGVAPDNSAHSDAVKRQQYRDVCGKCGATRVDRQLGLEATPDEYVTAIVSVFREVRRVLRADGTLWLNLGDSYAPVNYGANAKLRQDSPGSDETMQGRAGHWAADIGGSRSQQMSRGAASTGIKQKDLCGMPWRVAFALQADGWYLRSDIIWSKPNPMPESVTDRPTKAHEYVFLLSKSPRYFFDQEAVREGYRYDGRRVTTREAGEGSHENHRSGTRERWPGIGKASHGARGALIAHGHDESEPMDITHGGRNLRSVWEIATQPYPDAHFATFPEALPDRCIRAGCPVDGTVLDPFLGSGTTALVARKLGRRSIGIELSEEYARLAAQRLQQLSLLAEAAS